MMVCPCCGAQQMLGVWMSRGQADILHKVMRAGTEGYFSGDWQGPRSRRRDCFKTHVYQINCRLEETDWRVRGSGGRYGGYFQLVKVR